KLGDGSVNVSITLNPQVEGNSVKVKAAKGRPQSHVDAKAQFVLGLMGSLFPEGGPALGFLGKLKIEKALEETASTKLGSVPDQIPVPGEPSQTLKLDFDTKSARFDSGLYQGKNVPVLVVVKDYKGKTAKESVACGVRKAFGEL